MAQNSSLVAIDSIRPYEKNPRDNQRSIDKVAKSIQDFGFLQPIVCDADGVILAGHTRYAAAKKLGLTQVPVLYASDLSPTQAKAYRLADNKVGEESRWMTDFLVGEIETISDADMAIDMCAFGFDSPSETKRYKSWENLGHRCGFKKNIKVRAQGGYLYTSFFSSGKEGRPLEEIKADPTLVEPFAYSLCDYLHRTLGENLSAAGWCICTTPRRRHKTGFHFSTAICEVAAKELGIPFYPDAIESHSRDRFHPDFTLVENPKEPNVILYDDILTTGLTMRDSRQLLLESGHIVLPIVAINN